MYHLFQWHVVLLVIAKRYLYGTVQAITISSNINDIVMFLFAFFHTNILLYEISLDLNAIINGQIF